MFWLLYTCILFGFVGFSVIRSESDLEHDLPLFGGIFSAVLLLRCCWHAFRTQRITRQLAPLQIALAEQVRLDNSIRVPQVPESKLKNHARSVIKKTVHVFGKATKIGTSIGGKVWGALGHPYMGPLIELAGEVVSGMSEHEGYHFEKVYVSPKQQELRSRVSKLEISLDGEKFAWLCFLFASFMTTLCAWVWAKTIFDFDMK